MPHRREAAEPAFDHFAEEYPYPVLRIDEGGRVLYANPASLPVLLEWNAEIGGTVRSEVRDLIAKVRAEAVAQKLEVEHGRAVLELTFALSSRGDAINVYGRDVTTEKIAQEEGKRLFKESERIKESLERAEVIGKHGSWEWDLKDRTFSCSKGLFHLLKWNDDIVPTYELFLSVPLPDDRTLLEQAMEESVRSKQAFSCSFRVRLPDGEVRWVRSEANPVLDMEGRPVKLLGTVQDVHDKIRGEMDLTEATLRADAASRAKAEFLANMSHEIRTPMNGVIGMCTLLLSSVRDPAQIEQLRVIESCGNSLLAIINDVLDFSKLEAGKVVLEKVPFDIHRTAGEVVKLLTPKAVEKDVSLSYSAGANVPPWVLGDPTRFRQILTNLVSNAVKFTEKGGITIASDAKMREDAKFEILFSVMDTGIGISENERARLFTSFSQADVSTTRKYGGTGLGLAISRGLCEQMGGKVWVESVVGKGSTFSFTLVLEGAMGSIEDVAGGAALINGLASPAESLEILIGEDNRVNQLVAVGLLEKLGYFPDVAGNGVEVLERVAAKKYDIVLMDVHMPEMDGIEAARAIRERYGDHSPFIVALTASAMREDVERCFAAGMNDFVGKPIQVPELVRVLSSVKERKEAPSPARTASGEANRVGSGAGELPFDRERFVSNYVGIEDVRSRVIAAFIASKPGLINNLGNSIQARDAKALLLAAHTIKGAVLNFFAERAARFAAELERRGVSGEFAEVEELSHGLIDELERLAAALAKVS